MAERESVVRIVIALLANTIPKAAKTPALPTTTSKRKNMMTPKIVNTQGVNTPAKVHHKELQDLINENNVLRNDIKDNLEQHNASIELNDYELKQSLESSQIAKCNFVKLIQENIFTPKVLLK